METLDYSTKALAWIGLVCVAILGGGTAYLWTCYLWQALLEKAAFPVALWRATKIAVQLSITKDKNAFAANYVVGEIAKAMRESPEFKKAFQYKTTLLASWACDCGGFPHGKHCAAVAAGVAEHTPTTPNGD